jgi:hypothetical protein
MQNPKRPSGRPQELPSLDPPWIHLYLLIATATRRTRFRLQIRDLHMIDIAFPVRLLGQALYDPASFCYLLLPRLSNQLTTLGTEVAGRDSAFEELVDLEVGEVGGLWESEEDPEDDDAAQARPLRESTHALLST